MNKELLKRAAELFATHPKQDAFHFTSDKMAHATKKQAQIHADKTRRDKVVTTVTKEEVAAYVEGETAAQHGED